MASLELTPTYGSWRGSVSIPFETYYNRDTNQTTVSFSQATVSYWGRPGYGTRMDCSITITSDSGESKAVTLTTFGYTQGDSVFWGTPSPSSVIVSNAAGSGSKSVTLSVYLAISVYATSSSTSQSVIEDSGSLPVTVGSRYTLSISQDSGCTVTATRNGVPLSNGAIISSGESITMTYSVNPGYTENTHTINGYQFYSGWVQYVGSDLNVVVTTSLLYYSLQIQSSNSSVSVNRTSSPVGGAPQGYLNSGAILYYGDVLSVVYSSDAGYTITTHEINDSEFESGYSHTVAGSVLIRVVSSLNEYSVEILADLHSTIQLNREASPVGKGSTGILDPNTDDLYYQDVIVITAIVDPGYGVDSLTLNGVVVSNPYRVSVEDSLSISVVSKVLGFVYIDSGSTVMYW